MSVLGSIPFSLTDGYPKPSTLLVVLPVAIILIHVVPYLLDPFKQRCIPGPLFARFSDLWLGWTASQGRRSEVVHELHEKYGTLVRLAPNHVSIADPGALRVVYAHGNGALKSNFYDAFVSIHRGLFNSRDRQEHARKRKIASPIFSPKNVLELEPISRIYIEQLLQQWDQLCDAAIKGRSGTEGEGGWYGRDGRLWLDCLPWYSYLAFDIIGDLAFGSPFGMVVNAKDSAPVVVSREDALKCYGTEEKVVVVDVPAIRLLTDRGEFSASVGALPPSWRYYVRLLPWYRQGGKALQDFTNMAVAAVAKRLATPTDRIDLLSRLQQGRDDEGKPMGKAELTAEALTYLTAGSDTTSISSCAITYYLARYPHVQEKLQKELDEALSGTDDIVATFEQVKRLPYLDAVINEGLRLYSTSGLGLPRIVPEGGLTVNGIYFPPGAILSVPTYTIHKDKSIWGDDVDVFRPERWFELDHETVHKAFNPFSFGPRACVGRSLASMNMLIIISSVLRRYHLVLAEPDKPLVSREGFFRKPTNCRVGIKRRQI